MGEILGISFFIQKPRRADNLMRNEMAKQQKAYFIEKIIELDTIDFQNFATDMTVERDYLRKNYALCRIDEKGVWHCLLVCRHDRRSGLLIMADALGRPTHAGLRLSKRPSKLH